MSRFDDDNDVVDCNRYDDDDDDDIDDIDDIDDVNDISFVSILLINDDTNDVDRVIDDVILFNNGSTTIDIFLLLDDNIDSLTPLCCIDKLSTILLLSCIDNNNNMINTNLIIISITIY